MLEGLIILGYTLNFCQMYYGIEIIKIDKASEIIMRT